MIHQFSFILLLQGLFFQNTLAAKALIVEFSKPLAENSTDDSLFPLTIGEDGSTQVVYLTPSTSTNHTFAISPKACTPPGNDTAWEGCVNYRGGVFDPSKSSSHKPGSGDSSKLEWSNGQFVLFAEGTYGQDTVTLKDMGGDVQLKDFELGVVDACNMTSGFLGLGPGSTLLERLVKDGKIDSRSYGLHVGIDITNHPWPVFDPTFDSGEKPKDNSDYDSGTGRLRRRQDDETREVHSFEGGLTFGGYDASRIDNATKSLVVPLSSEGLLELELTEMVAINQWIVDDSGAHDLFNGTRKVVIDSGTPYMYLPQSTASQLAYTMEAEYGDPYEDFFYGSDPEKYLGNVTFTLQAPGGNESIKIVVPPSVFQQPIGMLRDYEPVGDGYYDYYMPIKSFKDSSKQPIILGRSFLKAGYIFVNYDKKNFHLSQVAYNNGSHNVIPVSPTGDDDVGPGNTDSQEQGSESATNPPGPPIATIAGAVGGGALVAAIIGFILWRRRGQKAAAKSALRVIPSDPSFHGNELDGAQGGHQLVSLPPAAAGRYDEKQQYPNDAKADYWAQQPPPPQPQGYYEMESSQVGLAVSPSGQRPAHAPSYAELPVQHPAAAHGQHHPGPVPSHERYEMM